MHFTLFTLFLFQHHLSNLLSLPVLVILLLGLLVCQVASVQASWQGLGEEQECQEQGAVLVVFDREKGDRLRSHWETGDVNTV